MVEEEQLYSDVPPTKLRNKEEKFTPAKTTKFWVWFASLCFFNMLQNRFYAFRYRGAENYFDGDRSVPTVLFAPHSNWWDGIVFYNITHRIFHKEIRMMIEELNRFPLFSKGGAYSVNKKSAQSAMKALKYSVDLLSDLRNILCIFPQGIIRPPHYRPIEFQTGLAYIAQNAVKKYGKINLIPVAFDYVFFRDNRPEVVVDFGKRIEFNKENIPQDRKELNHMLEKALEKTCDEQFEEISHGDVTKYDILFKQHLKWYRRIEQRLKRIDIPPLSEV